MNPPGFRKIGERVLHAGPFVTFAIGEFEAPDGRRLERDLAHHPGAVGVVVVEDDEVVLVRQYRAPIDADLLEIPAGKLDAEGEDPETAAVRECIEEVGRRPRSLEWLTSFYNSAGFCDELTHVYLATELDVVDDAREGVEEQYMTVERYGLDEVPDLLASGRVCDAKTNVGLLAALRRLGR